MKPRIGESLVLRQNPYINRTSTHISVNKLRFLYFDTTDTTGKKICEQVLFLSLIKLRSVNEQHYR